MTRYRGAEAWWLNPALLLGFFVLPAFVLVCVAPSFLGSDAIVLRYRSYLSSYYLGLGVLFLSVAILGAWIGTRMRPGSSPESGSLAVADIYLDVLAIATVAAYCIWFRGLLIRPWVVVGVFTGQLDSTLAREANRTIPGVTTLTQLGIAYGVFYLSRIWGSAGAPLKRRFHWYAAIILWFAVFRVFVWAERLALIELIVPAAVIFFMRGPYRKWWWGRTVARLGPLLGVGVLLAYFGATEFFRSWSSHYQYHETSFWSFIGHRVLTYYYTALNNGAGMLEILDWPTYHFEYLLAWLFRFPALIGPIFRYTVGVEGEAWSYLHRYADPEFNNLSGIYTVYFDVGIAGAILYAALWGAVLGYFYNSFRCGAGVGSCLYPVLFMGPLEVLRMPYLNDPRALPAVVALAIGYALFRHPSAVPSAVVRRPARHLVLTARWLDRFKRVERKM